MQSIMSDESGPPPPPSTNSGDAPKSFSRKACLADFFDNSDDINISSSKHQHNKHHSHNDSIEKNQQEFGHKKRIKP